MTDAGVGIPFFCIFGRHSFMCLSVSLDELLCPVTRVLIHLKLINRVY